MHIITNCGPRNCVSRRDVVNGGTQHWDPPCVEEASQRVQEFQTPYNLGTPLRDFLVRMLDCVLDAKNLVSQHINTRSSFYNGMGAEFLEGCQPYSRVTKATK